MSHAWNIVVVFIALYGCVYSDWQPEATYSIPWTSVPPNFTASIEVSVPARFVFSSGTFERNLIEVSQEGYATCNATAEKFIRLWVPSEDNWTVFLDVPSRDVQVGWHYFICTWNGTFFAGSTNESGIGGLCLSGLKLAIEVSEASPPPIPDQIWKEVLRQAETHTTVFLLLVSLVPLLAVGIGVCILWRRRRNADLARHRQSTQYQMMLDDDLASSDPAR
eukprot:TRINITY_DN19922_c0_g1_i1.p1 TRINITY_DN19922_c0_g1~~TRINITY_DN19922_c0_g1_i1.p1  ORF type:complete len:221 (+),score=0.21 TRINITY_DN19922_c0_g1_i1:181-843(+)